MSQTIDDRIVSLEFDNKQFEKNVGESLTTLQKLKESLKLDDAAKGLSDINQEAKKVDLSTVADSIDKLSEKFSTMRMVGLMALSNLVDGAMNFAKKIGSALTAPIQQMKTGGWTRAMNLEQANFMMKGLLKEEGKVQAVMNDVSESVDGTAYSLDEAAKVAAQFAASGLKAGSTMLPALKAVAGTAAMTNTSFAEIGQIFTTVAGQGKLMTKQMRQLEFRGLNVAATLGEQLGKTEAEIRDMVTKGSISFEMFSDAMNKAFGEHATEANNTFEGALSNMKSALNRIGAEFATPILNYSIPVFNSLRLMINAIKNSMGDVFYIFKNLTAALSGKLVKTIDKITAFIKGDSFKFNGLRDLNDAMMRIITSIMRIGSAIKTAFKNVFNGSMGDHINNIAAGINKISKVLRPSEAALDGLTHILTIIFRLIKSVGTIIGTIVSKLGGPLLTVLSKIINVIFGIVGVVGNVISAFANWIKQSNIIEKTLTGISIVIIKVKEGFNNFKTAISDSSTVIGKAANVISTAFKYIGLAVRAVIALPIYGLYLAFNKIRELDFSKLVDGLSNAKNVLIDFFKYVYNLPIVQSIINGITTAFLTLVGAIYYVGTAIYDFFVKLASGEITFETIKQKILEFPNVVKDVWAQIVAKFADNSVLARLEQFRQGIIKVFDKITAFFNNNPAMTAIRNSLEGIGLSFVNWTSTLKTKLAGLTPAKVLLMAFAGVMTVLAFNANKLTESITGLVDKATGAVGSIADFLTKKKTKLEKFTQVVITLSIAVLSLAAAFKIMSTIPKENLVAIAITLGAFVAGFLALAVAIAKLDKEGNFAKRMKDIGIAMTALGVTLLAISSALSILNNVPVNAQMWKRIGMLGACLGLLAGFGVLMNFFGPKTISQALGILAFAITIQSVARALSKLSGIDFSGIKGAWKEIAVLILGLAGLSTALAAVGTGVFLGVIAYLIIAKTFMSKVGEFADEGTDTAEKLSTFKTGLMKMAAYLSEALHAIYEAFTSLTIWQRAGLITIVVAGFAALIGAIYFIFRGLLKLTNDIGKGFKKMAVGFLLISAAIAALVLVGKYIAESIGKDQTLLANFTRVMEIIGGLILVIGAMMLLSKWGNSDVIKSAKKIFSSLGFMFIAMAGLFLVLSTMTPAQIDRANDVITRALLIIGAIVVVSELLGAIASKGTAGFGHFAGVVLLFGAIMGSLAALIIYLQDEKDYLRLGVALAAIAIVLSLMIGVFEAVSHIKYKATWKTLLVMIGGLIAIGAAIVFLAKQLPDQGYIGKIIAVSASMLLVFAALMGLILLINHLSKDTKFTVTKTSSKTIKTTLLEMLALVGMFAILAGVIGVLEKFGGSADRMLAVSQVIVLVVLELAAIAVALGYLAKHNIKAVGALGVLMGYVLVFGVLSIVIGVLEKFGGTADRMLAVSQVIVLVVLELAAIAVALGFFAVQGALAILALPSLLGLTLVFGILALIAGVLNKFGGEAGDMLKKTQVITLLLVELSAIAVLLGLLVVPAALAILALPSLLGLTAVFAVLAYIAYKIQDIDIESAMPKMEMLEQFIWKLMGVMTALAALSVGALGELAGSVSLLLVAVAIVELSKALQNLESVNLDHAAQGIELVGQALSMMSTAASGAAALGVGLIVLAVGIAALGVACSIATPGIIGISQAIMILGLAIAGFVTAISNSLDGAITVISKFPHTFSSTFMLGMEGVISNIIQVGANIGKKFIQGFRDAIGWHSPIDDVMAFFDQLKTDFKTRGADAATFAGTIGDKIASNFGLSFENFDIFSITEIFGIEGMNGLVSGVQAGEGSLLGEFTRMLGMANNFSNAMSTALQTGQGTLSDFQYQLQTNYGAAKQQVEYYAKKKSEFKKGNLYEEKWADAIKELEAAEKALNDFNGTATDATDITQQLTAGIGDVGKSSKSSAKDVKDLQESLTSTLTSQMNIFSKFEEKQAMSKTELLNNMKSQITGMTNWAASMKKLSEKGIDQALYMKLAEMGVEGAQYVAAFNEMTSEELAQANEMWAQSLVLPGDIAKGIGVDFQNIGKNVGAGLSGGIDSSKSEVEASTREMVNEGTKEPAMEELDENSPSKVFYKYGFWIDLGLANGITLNMHFVLNAIRTMCMLAVDEARKGLDPEKFKPIGAQVVEGVQKGIEENMSVVETAAKKLATLVETALKSKEALDINSPSKKMIPIGMSVDEGLAKGIDKGASSVVRSIGDLSGTAVDQMKYTIANITSALNDEMQDPVIKPILDLSNVQAGVRTLNGIFGNNQALIANPNANLQNGQYSANGNVVFNQYNTSPKALTRYEIYRDTRNMLNQFRSAQA